MVNSLCYKLLYIIFIYVDDFGNRVPAISIIHHFGMKIKLFEGKEWSETTQVDTSENKRLKVQLAGDSSKLSPAQLAKLQRVQHNIDVMQDKGLLDANHDEESNESRNAKQKAPLFGSASSKVKYY